LKTFVVIQAKNIAIAILGGKSIAVLTAIPFSKSVLQYTINFDFCHWVQLFKNFGLTTDYVIMWSAMNLNYK